MCLQAWVKYLDSGQKSVTRPQNSHTFLLFIYSFQTYLGLTFHLHHTVSYMHIHATLTLTLTTARQPHFAMFCKIIKTHKILNWPDGSASPVH